jgi:hypothetical protein
MALLGGINTSDIKSIGYWKQPLLFSVKTAHAEGGGVDVGGVVRLGEGVGDFVAVVLHFAVEGMGDVELEVGERRAETVGALGLHLADQLARFAVAEHITDGELCLLIGVQAQLAHYFDHRPVAVGPQRQMLFDFDQQTLRTHPYQLPSQCLENQAYHRLADRVANRHW